MLSRKALKVTPSPTMAIDARAKEMKSEGIDVIGFGAGEPDFNTPPHIGEAGIKAINEGYTRYTPPGGMPELKKAICAKLKRENGLDYGPEQIIVSNGAKHSLAVVFAALCNPGDEVLIPAPYWVSYPEIVSLNDGTPVIIETRKEDNFKLNPAALVQALTPKSKALILNSPSNPTGLVYTRGELEQIAAVAVEKNILVISDEVYEKFIYGEEEHVSIASLGPAIKPLTVLVNGVSKTYAMTGWRIGYTAAEPKIARAMDSIQSHTASNPNTMAQVASIAALTSSQESVKEMHDAFAKRRDYMVQRIRKMPHVSCIEPKGAFYLFMHVGEAFQKAFRGEMVTDGDRLATLLLEHYRVALVPGGGFGAPEYARLSYAISMNKIEEGMNRLELFLQELQ